MRGNDIFVWGHNSGNIVATTMFNIYWDNAQYQQKKPAPQANENHCLRPFVEKQVFRTCLSDLAET